MVFPYILITTISMLFGSPSPMASMAQNINGEIVYTGSVPLFTTETSLSISKTTINMDSRPSSTFAGNNPTVMYFMVNTQNPSQHLQELRIGHNYYDETNRHCYITVDFSCTKAIDGWKQAYAGNGVEEYNNWDLIYYTIEYRNSFNTVFSINRNLDTTLTQSVTYEYDFTYEAMPEHYWENITYTVYIQSRGAEQYYTAGYNDGLSESGDWNLSNYLYSIVDIPVLYLRSMFGFDLFGGISLFAVITTLLTISVVIFVIRKFIK